MKARNIRKTKDNLVVLGDLHGDLEVIYKFIQKFNISNTTILQVGDFGYGFSSEQLEHLDNYLKSTSNNLFVVRGNHDNYYNHNPLYGKPEYTYRIDCISFLNNRRTLMWRNKKILCIGGAISIDRKVRVRDVSWWEQEAVEVIDIDRLEKDIDIVIAHTNPASFKPYGFNALCQHYFKNDPELENELIVEREYMQSIFEYINPKLWVHGHFHFSDNYMVNDCKIVALGIDEFYQIS